MRRSMALVAGISLVLTAAVPAAGAAPSAGGQLGFDDQQSLAAGMQTTGKSGTSSGPHGPNPYLALLPDPSKADYAGWRQQMSSGGDLRSSALAAAPRLFAAAAPLPVRERERAGARGQNDRRGTAQRIVRFGTAGGENTARIVGRLSPEAVTARRVRSNRENDGSIRRARRTGVPGVRNGIRTSGRIGDGPHGRRASGSGDFDFYRVRVPAGHRLVARVLTPRGRLDPMVAVFDSRGRVVAFNDDRHGLDSFLDHTVETPGVYTVMVSGFFAVPRNPFRSGSGTGAQSEGRYRLRIRVSEDDRDVFAVPLRVGDVLGASTVGGATRATIYNPAGVEVKGSGQDASAVYPASSPLPGGGNAVTEHVADQNGLHYIALSSGAGRYTVTVEAYRPRLEGGSVTQTLFLDFNGARINTGRIWGGRGQTTLSPLRRFLPRWGLGERALDPLITAITAEVRENVRADLVARGLDDDFDIVVRNSRDHRDRFGIDENVSRVIVGGTIRQSGIPTIGIAESIDPGNFDTEESALVLLDLLSSRRGPSFSLNTWLRPSSNRVAFVGQAIGNVVAHEAGHFFGDWHVDQFNRRANLMDQGGAFRVMYGVGPDRIGGSADDRDVDFGVDALNPNEGFTGLQNTLTRIAVTLLR
ncbi:MAG: hypothetical protein ACRDOJ_06985 [Nocardioidaceae bacterium]